MLCIPVQAEVVQTRDTRGILAAVSRIHRIGAVGRVPSSVGVRVLVVEVFLDVDPQPVGGGEGDKRGEGSKGGLETHGNANGLC